MKYHKPSFFDQFKCIGSACTDTCCAGWEIEVDEGILPKRVNLVIVCVVRLEASPVNISSNYRTIAVHF